MTDQPAAALTSPDSAQIAAHITAALDRLRSFSQVNIQSHWRYCLVDLPGATATQAHIWKEWQQVQLNDRQHIAWEKGRQVIWLGQRLIVPAQVGEYTVEGLLLRLSLTWWAEVAQVFVNGKLVQEGDLFDHSARILLSEAVQPGAAIDLAIRLVSPGHDNGALVRSSCVYELPDQSVNPVAEPGFVADELAVLQTYLTQFAPEKLPTLAAAIDSIPWNKVGDRDSFQQALTAIRQTLEPLAAEIKQRNIQLLGHAHLDLAWLWAIEETWRAAERTFTSALNLQAAFPELTFCHSTPALYAWIEANRPDLFAAICAQIQTKRWEVVAGLWVEPELNVVSGESIARQVLYGQRYVAEKFGQINKIAWLPDTFGFCWQLPQILKQGGIDYFVTQKLRWNDTTQFPYDLFWWQSPDGSTILSYNSAPIGEGIDPSKMAQYACTWQAKTGLNTALWLPGVGDHGGGPTRDMLELAQRWQQSPFFPQLDFTTALTFLENITSSNSPENSPETTPQPSTLNPPDLPTWNDELYLEFHRGCYTTHADQKRSNRHCERLLYEAELFASIATLTTGAPYPQIELETAWKQVLFNQFHDILPGSSIPEVYVDADRAWEQAEQTSQQIVTQSLEAIVAHITLSPSPQAEARAVTVFNSLNWVRSEVVTISWNDSPDLDSSHWQICDLDGNPIPHQHYTSPTSDTAHSLTFLAAEIPAIGYRTFWLCPGVAANPHIEANQSVSDSNFTPEDPPAFGTPLQKWSKEDHAFTFASEDSLTVSTPLMKGGRGDQALISSSQPFTLENVFLHVAIDPSTGDLSSVFDKINQREVLSGAANQLQAFQDQGQYWDAWNIDPNYAQHPLPAAELLNIQHDDQSNPLQQSITVTRKIGESCFWQRYVLNHNDRMLRIETEVDWQERHVLVKAAFPLTVQADRATYEIPYAAIQRSTAPHTDRDKAKWEVPALTWADLSDAEMSYGVSVLSDYKHGYDAQPDQLRLTLLRSSVWPDPGADRGKRHTFTYALYPHQGNWQTAQTVRRGYELRHPLRVMPVPAESIEAENIQENRPASCQTLPALGHFLKLDAENLILSTLKRSEDNPHHWIIRCYESQGETASVFWQDELGLLDRNLDLTSLQPVDLLEQAIAGLEERGGKEGTIAPWKIATFRCEQYPVDQSQSSQAQPTS